MSTIIVISQFFELKSPKNLFNDYNKHNKKEIYTFITTFKIKL